jgi:hypothetical protein
MRVEISNRFAALVEMEKTKYMLLSHHQNADQGHDIKIANSLKMCQFNESNDSNKSIFDSGGN